jgi:heme A synthase
VLAVAAAVVVVASASRLSRSAGPPAGWLARTLTALVIAQAGLGLLNVILLAPVWLQLVHLVLADLVWISLVLLAASALAAEPAPLVAPGQALDVEPFRS